MIELKGNKKVSESIKDIQDILNQRLNEKKQGTIFIQSLESCVEINGILYEGNMLTIRIYRDKNEWFLSECKLKGNSRNLDPFLTKDVEVIIY